jgi:hypothetical protein
VLPFDVSVSGISKVDGAVLFKLEPVWWPADWLREDSRFKDVDINLSYKDYFADLSVDELKIMHEQFKPTATAGVYKYEGWQERIQPILKELEEAIYDNSDIYAHFRVHVFEWESGY